MIGIIDYDAGNIRSVEKALAALHEEAVLSRDPKTLLAADKLILPGVGAFGDAMDNLKKYGLDGVIHEAVDRQIPLLGICLGLQLLFDRSEESPGVEGLGILKGEIGPFPGAAGPENSAYGMEFPVSGHRMAACLRAFPVIRMCILFIPIICKRRIRPS